MRTRVFSLRIVSCLLLILSVIALPTVTHAAPDKQIIRLNVSPNGYPPYLIVDQGQNSGIIWDVVTLIAERLGYEVVAEKIPRKRVDQMILQNIIDATPRAIEWTDQPERFLFTDPVVAVEEVLFIPTDSDLVYESPADLFSKTVVTQLGYKYPPLESYFKSGKIRRFDVSRDRDMFDYLLHSDHFVAGIADRLLGMWVLRNEGLQTHFRISAEHISNYGLRIMLRREWRSFAQAFNRELAAIRENGELDAILANYR